MIDPRYERHTIAVIEDENHTRAIIRGLLKQLGVRSIVEAADGGVGLKEVIRSRPSVVLCDIHMEPVDGLTFVFNLRHFAVPAIAKIPVIMLTADAQRETVEAARDSQIHGYIVKPVSLTTLKQRLDKVLGFT